jgi:phosphoribosylamine--glycine ligase
MGDFLELCFGAASGDLNYASTIAKTLPNHAVTVVLASQGYPDTPIVNLPITGIPALRAEGALVFEAGTKFDVPLTERLSNGGRVLTVTGLGESIEAAKVEAYQTIQSIHLSGSFYRKDIGFRAE